MADPYLINSAGYSVEDDDPALMLPPLAKQRALSATVRPQPQKTRLTSIPTAGPLTPEPGESYTQATPAPAAQRPDYRQQAYDATKQANEAATTMPDMSQQVQRYRQGYEGAGADIGLSMFLGGVGGRMGREMGGEVFKQALARRQPERTPYGTLDYEGGFTADPMKDREFKINRLEKQAQLFETMATHAETAQERERAHRAAEQARQDALQLRRDAMRMHQENLAEQRATRRQALDQGRFQVAKDAEGNPFMFNSRTGEIMGQGGPGGAGAPGGAPGAPGAPGQFPARVSPKATEDERRIASQVQRIVGSGALMTPEGAAPGAMEAAAGTLPYVGGNAAAGVRGMSGTLGIGEDTRQTTYQSQADIIDALLYISTGAAYNKEQLETMREAYMPAYTDNAISRRDKTQRLLGMIESAKVRAGRAWTQDAENALQKMLPTLTGQPAPPPSKPIRRAPGALPQTNLKNRVNSYYD